MGWRCQRSHARTSLLGTVRTGCHPSPTACSVTIAPSVARASSPSAAVRPLEREPWRARMRSTVDGETHPPVPNTSSGEPSLRCDGSTPPHSSNSSITRPAPHPRMQWIGLPPGGWSSRRLVVPRCRQHRTRCRSSLSVGPLWLRCRRTELAFGRLSDRLSTEERAAALIRRSAPWGASALPWTASTECRYRTTSAGRSRTRPDRHTCGVIVTLAGRRRRG